MLFVLVTVTLKLVQFFLFFLVSDTVNF